MPEKKNAIREFHNSKKKEIQNYVQNIVKYLEIAVQNVY